MGSINKFEINKKPHAVCIPYPAQGHINPMFKLAKILHQRGFHITYVNTEFNHDRLKRSRGPEFLQGWPSFRFETIPDGLPPSDPNATQDVLALCESINTNFLGPFRELLARLNDSDVSDVPPVTCIVSDGVMSFTVAAAEELGIPEVLFWTTSACGLLGYMQYAQLIEKGYTPLKDESYLTNGYLDTKLDWIEGLRGITLRDLPSFVRTTDQDDILYKFFLIETGRANRASAIVINTFYELEHESITTLQSILPPVYSIGPVHLLEKHVVVDDNDNLRLLRSSLWKEDLSCLDWLDTKPDNSVVYVNFGSITVMTPSQLAEFAWGLASCRKPFLWIVRPDLVSGEKAILPPEFVEETRDRGMLTSWCPQEQVLGHQAVSVFLTHNGWNSTLESISSGVPMMCWPFFAEQPTNRWFCCEKWGVGVEIDNNVKRSEIEKLVWEIMDGEKGKEMKRRAMELKKLAQDAGKPHNGSSYVNIEKVINHHLLRSKD